MSDDDRGDDTDEHDVIPLTPANPPAVAPAYGTRRRVRVRRRRRVTMVVGALILVPLLVFGAGVSWFLWELGGSSSGKTVQVHLERGWGVPRIGDQLAHQHIVRSSLAFNIYARFNGDNSFQAGTYQLRENLGVKAAVRELKKGPRIDYQLLSVPPGLWLKQIATRVGNLGGGRTASTFLDGTRNNAVRSLFEPAGTSNLEGLVRPDTYKISESQDEISVLQTMVTAFDANAAKLGLTNANVRGHVPYDIIIIASMIEAEAKVPQDRPLIASVIYNRLAANMPLQIDSTLIYGRGDPKNRHLSTADLQMSSLYNTYTHTGLPPTPIGAVSDASLRAAMAPADTTFLYYVLAGKDGHHAFSSTEQQWQQDVNAARAAGLL
jgi:UPF0755 protein